MENTIENKSKFFAQYWGQNVFEWHPENSIGHQVSEVSGQIEKFTHCGTLLLKLLSSITDEDAIFISQLVYGSEFNSVDMGVELVGGFNQTDLTTPLKFLMIADYIRSKGYALPYNGLSVEEQVSYGWIKLIEE